MLAEKEAVISLSTITNLEWSFMRSKYNGIPEHDVVLGGSSTDPSGRILL